MPTGWGRGSEWLRWDPHLHAPGTALNDQFGGDWDGYFDRIEAADPAVAALGITDYMGVGCYEEFRRRRGGRAPGVRLVFPNIEFRLTPFTSDDKAINAHLLVSPEHPQHVQEIRNALANLTFNHDAEIFRCDDEGLTRLGLHDDPRLTGQAAYRRGLELFKPPFESFRKWWEGSAWLKKNSLVVVDGSSDDGAAGIPRAGWAAVRDDVYRFAHAIFSPREKEREFWLGRKDARETARLGGPKPCLHGSDAHDIARTCSPVQSRYTWIKAEATFEGLRQTLYEPAERVWIGERPPDERPGHRVIAEVRFTASAHWLKNESVTLNPGLVTIIGPRGSGKTALADMIAAANGAPEAGPGSFLTKASDQLGASAVTVAWANGTESAVIAREAAANPNPAVRYLSQQFVERLCSQDELSEGAGGGLLDEIEAVIFSRLDESDATFATNFAELRDAKCEPFDAAIRSLAQEISELTRRIFNTRESEAQQGTRREAIKKLSKEGEALEQHTRKLVGPENPTLLREVQELQAKATEARGRIAGLRATDQGLENLGGRYRQIERQLSSFHDEEARQKLLLAGASEPEIDAVRPRFGADPLALIARLRAQVAKQIEATRGAGNPPPVGTLAHIQARLEELQKSLNADASRKAKVEETTKAIGAKKADLAKLEREVAQVEREVAEMPKQVERRLDAYLGIFESIGQKKKSLEALYSPLREQLDTRGASEEREMEFYVRTRVRLKAWAGAGEALLDRRRWTRDVEALARDHLLDAWGSGDRGQLETGMRAMVEAFRDVKKYLRAEATLQAFGDWLFSTDHILLQYGLKFDGTDLDHLSPGAKGVALLMLYLSIDTNDERPLIIDQPEENLDPKSVYDVLVPHIRRARNRRQVIIVTHNPNLVVNTDADQVIVASSERRERGRLPEISYVSGALEDAATRKAVCDILEGGADAFLQRERKYRLDPRSQTR